MFESASWASPRNTLADAVKLSKGADGETAIRLHRPSPYRLRTRWPYGLPSPLLLLKPGRIARIAWNGRFTTSLAGSLNGNIFCIGQQSMAAGLEGVAPKVLAKLNKGEAPWVALIFTSALATALLLLNYSRGLVGAFTFLIMMTTVACLVAYLMCALAELKHSWRNAKAWAAIAIIAALYSAFAIFGAGQESLIWGFVLVALGVPVYYSGRSRRVAAAA